ncbi:hypothetical protein FPV67DRAFT_1190886 [Lyophyllum atratum]|nr:hypothetical protein FPV67DRAFT_1190886 [Lyophyllum atratum]
MVARVDSLHSSPTTAVNPNVTGSIDNVGKAGKLSPSAVVAITVGILAILGLMVALSAVICLNRTLWRRLKRGYMVQSQFDSMSPSADSTEGGFHVASDSKGSREPTTQATQTREVVPIRPVSRMRPISTVSNVSSSASTLVAEDGSNVGAGRRGLRFKRRSRQDQGTAGSRATERPPQLPPLPPQLPHIRPIGHLMPIESMPDLLEHPIAPDVDLEINIPVISPSVSTPSLASRRPISPVSPSLVAGHAESAPEASTSNVQMASTPSSAVTVPEHPGMLESGRPDNRDTRARAGDLPMLVIPPAAASTSSFGRDRIYPAGNSIGSASIDLSARPAGHCIGTASIDLSAGSSPIPSMTPKSSYGSLSLARKKRRDMRTSEALFRTRLPMDLNYA